MAETHFQGTVVRITFRNEDNGYTVAKVNAHDFGGKENTIVGNFPSIDVGELSEIHGEWVQDKQYGRQFAAIRIDFIVPTTVQGIENLLTKGKFRGIGKKYAKKIVETFGKDTISIIENTPEALMEIPGIGRKKVEQIKKSWNRKKALKHINIFLAEHNIHLYYAEKILARYRENALLVLRRNPYQLAEDIRGIGFRKADEIAAKIGIEPTSPDRIKAALIYLLKQAGEDGHTYLPKDELVQKGCEYLNLDFAQTEAGIERLAGENKLIIDNSHVYLRFLFAVEQNIVKRIFKILNDAKRDIPKPEMVNEIRAIENMTGISYTEKQKEALGQAMMHKITVITGGPGTGKTTIIRALIRLFQKRGLKIRLAAPTGRAAKRMEEACIYPAETIHRMLHFNPQHGVFERNPRSPLNADAVIIDELSMIDSALMAALLSGIDDHVRLVLVGDADQLPSVGPGNVLRDLLMSGCVPVIRLDVIFRQAETSDIVVAAHKINNGEVPRIDNSINKNLFFILEKDPSRIPDKVADLVKRRIPEKYGYNPLKDVQVLSSMYKGDTGANNLNSLLQKELNPGGTSIKRGDRAFFEGDKIMQVRNNYSKEVYNGDIGYITHIDSINEELKIQYDERIISYLFKELDEIVHAYAITVHKSQGSEYCAVVMPVTTQHYIMLQKNLLYTAITRAKELMIIIGTYKALNIAVKNNKTAERYSYLSERLRNPGNIETQLNLLEPITGSLSDWY